jgi:hypothetical protein
MKQRHLRIPVLLLVMTLLVTEVEVSWLLQADRVWQVQCCAAVH